MSPSHRHNPRVSALSPSDGHEFVGLPAPITHQQSLSGYFRRQGRQGLLVLSLFLALGSWDASAKNRAELTHTVASGHTLGKIAKRYNVSIEALCTANSISRNASLKIGQKILVPASDDKDGSQARDHKAGVSTKSSSKDSSKKAETDSKKTTGKADAGFSEQDKKAWTRYKRSAAKKGRIQLSSPFGRYNGYVLWSKGALNPKAVEAFEQICTSRRSGESHIMDEELLRVLVKISDAFGGKEIRVVSGYREESHHRESNHKVGKATDIHIEGVPNWALRDFARTLPGVGVGYYPNSSFVHIDVRSGSQYWIDYSGPGEAPDYETSSREKTKWGDTGHKSRRGPAKTHDHDADSDEKSDVDKHSNHSAAQESPTPPKEEPAPKLSVSDEKASDSEENADED